MRLLGLLPREPFPRHHFLPLPNLLTPRLPLLRGGVVPILAYGTPMVTPGVPRAPPHLLGSLVTPLPHVVPSQGRPEVVLRLLLGAKDELSRHPEGAPPFLYPLHSLPSWQWQCFLFPLPVPHCHTLGLARHDDRIILQPLPTPKSQLPPYSPTMLELLSPALLF